MKIAVISDIHANLEALEAVLAQIQADGCEEIYCLGDVVGYGPNPNECCALCREREIPTTLGNHDEAAVVDDPVLEPRMSRSAAESIRWTRRVLSPANQHWLAALPLTIDLPRANAILCHANLHNPQGWGYIQTRYEAHLTFQRLAQPLCFHGHSHSPGVISRIDATGEMRATSPESVQVSEGERYLMNCGSIGQPRDGDHRSCYVVYDTAMERIVFRRVPYPKEITQSKIIAAGLPAESAFRLSSGM